MGWPSAFLSAAVHGLALALILAPWPDPLRRAGEAGEVVPIDIVLGETTDVQALAPLLEEEPEPVAAEPPAEEQPAPAPLAAPPPVSRDAPRSPPPQLDLAELRSRINQNNDADPAAADRPDNARDSDQIRPGAGRGQAETARLSDRFSSLLYRHVVMNRCWNQLNDTPELRIEVTVRLNRQGRIMPNGVDRPALVSGAGGQAVLDEAVRAARACDPYPFPREPEGPDNYDLWRQIELCFGPRCPRRN
jgi:hypothetical protein